MPDLGRYCDFVEHPRFGRGPRFTRLTPQGDVYLGWHTQGLIPNTAVCANIQKQVSATMHVTHYFDLERLCHDCGRSFIFFADEQKHWYEDLQFGLDSDCIRCVPCRKQQQGVARMRQQYEELFQIEARTPDQSVLMAECCLDLIEHGIFSAKQTQRVRMLLNSLADENDWVDKVRMVRQRLLSFEADLENE